MRTRWSWRGEKKMAKMQRGHAGLITKRTRAKEQVTCMAMVKLLHNDEQELLGVWAGCHWDDNAHESHQRSMLT